jgi:FtsP/CotA-like multicopper oxidase with cupredoxin domain
MSRSWSPSRRALLGGALAGAVLPRPLAAQPAAQPAAPGKASLTLRVAPASLPLRAGGPPGAAWAFDAPSPPRLARGDQLQFELANQVTAPLALSWRGLGGAAVEPLTARPPLLPGQSTAGSLALRHAGTVLCDTRLLGDGQAHALPALALAVAEPDPPAVDQDVVLLIEDWRLRADGSTAAPGGSDTVGAPLFTVNGRSALDLPVIAGQRLRLRCVNGCQRAVVALRIDDHEVRVMAVDGQPAEPFVSRDSQLILAPGSRIDAFVDARLSPGATSTIQLHDGTAPRPLARLVYDKAPALRATAAPEPAPLPGNGLPAKLDLRSALRADLVLDGKPGGGPADWLRPASLNGTAVPAFRVGRGRVVVLTLSNRAGEAVTFHLHGHAFRWLDRLDDGWKPFWLDTMMVEAGATHRIAFLADQAGPWLLEAMATRWEAPRLARWYVVE